MSKMFRTQNREGMKYGFLYNNFSVRHVDFAPTDWATPTETDVDDLCTAVGGNSVAGGILKESGTTHWQTPNVATNASGFTAYGQGYRVYTSGDYLSRHVFTMFWTKTQAATVWYYMLRMDASSAAARFQDNTHEGSGLPVRLIYTGVGTPTSMTDYEGNVYDVVKIGSQYWTVQNWRCKFLNDGTPLLHAPTNTAWLAAVSSGDEAYCSWDNIWDYI